MTTPFLRRTAVLAAATLTAVGVASAAPAYRGPRPRRGNANDAPPVRLIATQRLPRQPAAARRLVRPGHARPTGPPSTPAAPRSSPPTSSNSRPSHELARAQRAATTSAPRRWRRRCSTTSRRSSSSTPSASTRLGGRQPRVRRGLQGAAAHPVRRLPPDRRLPVPRPTYTGAEVPVPRRNITFTTTALPALLPFTVKSSGGMPIGIIGATLKDLPTSSSPTAIEDLQFGDEVAGDQPDLQRCWIGSASRAQIVADAPGRQHRRRGGPNACNLAAKRARPATIAENVTPERRRDLHRAQPPAVQLRDRRPERAIRARSSRACPSAGCSRSST